MDLHFKTFTRVRITKRKILCFCFSTPFSPLPSHCTILTLNFYNAVLSSVKWTTLMQLFRCAESALMCSATRSLHHLHGATSRQITSYTHTHTHSSGTLSGCNTCSLSCWRYQYNQLQTLWHLNCRDGTTYWQKSLSYVNRNLVLQCGSEVARLKSDEQRKPTFSKFCVNTFFSCAFNIFFLF